MKWTWLLWSIPYSTSLLFGTRKLNPLDKTHVKTYADSWIEIWKTHPTPLSDTRINEAWKSVIWCAQHRHHDYCHCLAYKHNNFFILVMENAFNETLRVAGIVESPENVYSVEQTHQLHRELTRLANQTNYTIDYSLLRNWSHGFYFYEYQIEKN